MLQGQWLQPSSQITFVCKILIKRWWNQNQWMFLERLAAKTHWEIPIKWIATRVLSLFSSSLSVSHFALLHLSDSASICASAATSSVSPLSCCMSHGRPYSNLITILHLAAFLHSLVLHFGCILFPIHLFSRNPLHCRPTLSVPLSHSHSWIGHTQGSNESTQRCLQEARFHRPSWITVTMEISTSVVTHTYTEMRCSWLLRNHMYSFLKIFTLMVCHRTAPRGQLGPPKNKCLGGNNCKQYTSHKIMTKSTDQVITYFRLEQNNLTCY